jgi:hypothetical protein
MFLIASALSLLVVYAGMKLLALTKKDTLGNGYKAVSWILIIMGFLILLCSIAHGVMHHRANRMMMQTEMRDDGWGGRHMGGMNWHHDMMMRGGCCDGMKDDCCGGMKDDGCHDGMGSSCSDGMKGCTMGKGDTTKQKK